jgi:hypothetical protein
VATSQSSSPSSPPPPPSSPIVLDCFYCRHSLRLLSPLPLPHVPFPMASYHVIPKCTIHPIYSISPFKGSGMCMIASTSIRNVSVSSFSPTKVNSGALAHQWSHSAL